MSDRIKELATYLFHNTDLNKAAARLCMDVVDGEPTAVADLKATGCTVADLHVANLMDGDEPTFLGGPEKNRPRYSAPIQRSRLNAYPDYSY